MHNVLLALLPDVVIFVMQFLVSFLTSLDSNIENLNRRCYI